MHLIIIIFNTLIISTMKQSTIFFLSNISYGELSQLGDVGVSLANRDMNDLARFGIDEEFIANLKQKNIDFKNFPTDEEFSGFTSKKTSEKDALRDGVQKGISDIMVRVKNKYGISSPDYKRFSSSNMYNETDSDLVRTARRVIRLATEYLNDLYEKGLRQSEIDELSSKIDLFDKSIEVKDIAVQDRDNATQKRAIMANKLYSLISELFDYGKQQYVDKDEAKYNDYVIYSNQTSSSTAPEQPKTNDNMLPTD